MAPNAGQPKRLNEGFRESEARFFHAAPDDRGRTREATGIVKGEDAM